jgi:hypothetical protein
MSLLVADNEQQTVLVATENGFGKRTAAGAAGRRRSGVGVGRMLEGLHSESPPAGFLHQVARPLSGNGRPLTPAALRADAR